MKILPSIMCADQLDLRGALAAVERGGADGVHVDVMDGHLVPGFTYGRDAVAAMCRATSLPLDLHLMSDLPLQHASQFWDLPLHSIVVHIEGLSDPVGALEQVRRRGLLAGVALNPETPASVLDGLYAHLDRIVVMAVKPGFVGQSQAAGVLEKARRIVASARDLARPLCEVVLDGGVKVATISAAAASGVHAVVSGTGVFDPTLGVEPALRALRSSIAPQEELP